MAQRTSRARMVDPTVLPSVDEAVQMYTTAGGTITRECCFGFDPLAADENLKKPIRTATSMGYWIIH